MICESITKKMIFYSENIQERNTLNTATYDLTIEPWIPVKTMDGARHHIGLRELFDTAGSIRRVDISDPVTFSPAL